MGMYDGVMFGDKHTYKDWGLIMTAKPNIKSPEAKTVYIEIPSSDGKLDMTTALTGDVKYANRTIEFTFQGHGDAERLSKLYSDIQDYLNGQDKKIVIDFDNCYYYTGRVSIEAFETKYNVFTLKMQADVDPYKYETFSSLEDWEWDPFDFETGIIREYKNLSVNGTRNLVIPCRRKQIIPKIYANIPEGKTLSVTYKGMTAQLSNGETRILTFVLPEGDQTLTFEGTGTISVDYRGARL